MITGGEKKEHKKGQIKEIVVLLGVTDMTNEVKVMRKGKQK
jgi:hypothetical protein